jgi:hypothetical protein
MRPLRKIGCKGTHYYIKKRIIVGILLFFMKKRPFLLVLCLIFPIFATHINIHVYGKAHYSLDIESRTL